MNILLAAFPFGMDGMLLWPQWHHTLAFLSFSASPVGHDGSGYVKHSRAILPKAFVIS
jgi:hypothetical protein